MASVLPRTREQTAGSLLVAAAGALVGLAPAVGIGLWHGAPHDRATTRSTAASTQAGTVAPAGRPMTGWSEEVYLMNSHEEAARFTSYLHSLAAVGGVSVESTAQTILVPGSEEEVAQAFRLPAEVRHWVDASAQIRVIDLRAQ